MRTIRLTPRDADSRTLSLLEQRALIKTLAPTPKISRLPHGAAAADAVYSSAPRFGGHKLLCVRPDSDRVKLNSHPDNEEFILIDPSGARGRPLYMLVGLSPHAVLEKKAQAGTLSEKDFVLLRMKFNDSRASVFTMLKDTVHCEIVFPGTGKAPVFFVTEPARLPMDLLRLPGYSFQLSQR
ncbi:MAG: hypothetical protein ACM3OC_08930 [Deltaproteobacteria bacterium]